MKNEFISSKTPTLTCLISIEYFPFAFQTSVLTQSQLAWKTKQSAVECEQLHFFIWEPVVPVKPPETLPGGETRQKRRQK